jgi:hypothetical protein
MPPIDNGMKIVNSLITFEAHKGSGPRDDYAEVTFPGSVSTVGCFLTGFEIGYAHRDDDHHLGQVDIKLRAERLDAIRVRVNAEFGLRDASGKWDDLYEGTVYFSVVGQ